MNHRHAWDLIPWFVNGTASDAERASLQRHLAGCAACRDEFEAQRQLHAAMRTGPQLEAMPHASLQQLWARIDAQPPTRAAALPSRTSRRVNWLTAAVVLQALLLGVLAVFLLRPRDGTEAAAYRTVSTQPDAPRTASVRAVFSPAMTLGELQALLERAHLRIVNGPSPDGVYTLATVAVADDAKQALLVLRAHPAVQFAEPVGP